MFAMLMAVSAPTLSTLLAAACDQASVSATASHCHAKPKAHQLGQKCGYCMLQADLPAAPPLPPAPALALLLPQRAAPQLDLPAPITPHHQLAPPPRAPPSA